MARSQVTLAGVSKALNDRMLREFCPDGHRVAWPAHMNGLGTTGDPSFEVAEDLNDFAPKLSYGLCTGGDYWRQQAPQRYGGNLRVRSGMEKASISARGAYDVQYALDLKTGEMRGSASLRCTLGHVSQSREKRYFGYRAEDPERRAEAEAEGWVFSDDQYATKPSPVPTPEDIYQMTAYVSYLLAAGWELRDGRLLCERCVVEFDALDSEVSRVAEIERQEAEQSGKRFEHRLRYRREFSQWVPAELDDARVEYLGRHRSLISIRIPPEVVREMPELWLKARASHGVPGALGLQKDGSYLLDVHPASLKRVEVES